jgi:hypothetical protein
MIGNHGKPPMKKYCVFFYAAVAAVALRAEELNVGPKENFIRIEDAAAAAKAGDVVLVHPAAAGAYDKVAVMLNSPNVTIRGVAVGSQRIAISAGGFNYSGFGHTPRAVFQFNKNASGCVLENFEIFGAHNVSHNGGGVRINQANNVTVRNCNIHHNDMGIMSNGDGTLESATNQLIEKCVIHHNGDKDEWGYNHNLYLGGASVKLAGCDIFSSLTGHNVKSRAHQTEIRDCTVHDSENREFDFVDAAETGFPGSDAVLVGNTISKMTNCPGNRGVIHFGQDTGKPRDGTLRLEGNTIRTPFVTPVIQLSAPDTRVVLDANTFLNSGKQQSGQILVDAKKSTATNAVSGRGNKIAPSFEGPALDALGLLETETAK